MKPSSYLLKKKKKIHKKETISESTCEIRFFPSKHMNKTNVTNEYLSESTLFSFLQKIKLSFI